MFQDYAVFNPEARFSRSVKIYKSFSLLVDLFCVREPPDFLAAVTKILSAVAMENDLCINKRDKNFRILHMRWKLF